MRLTEEQQDLLESVLNLASITADAQIDDDAKEDAYEVIEALADLFEIPRTRVTVDETENADGSLTFTVSSITEDRPKSHLKLVADNPQDNDNTPPSELNAQEPTDDDTRH